MKSRLIGHGIDMGLIQPLPTPLYTHRGDFVDSDYHEAQCLTFKKMLPPDKCDVILYHTNKYVIMLHFALPPYFWEYIILCISRNVYYCLLGLIFYAATKTTK